MVAMEDKALSKSGIKMYAVLFDKEVVSYAVLTEEELNQEKKQYSDHEFIEMTLENSPASFGMIWDGFKFRQKEVTNV